MDEPLWEIFNIHVFKVASYFELATSFILFPFILGIIFKVNWRNLHITGKIILPLLLLRKAAEIVPNLVITGVTTLITLTQSWYILYSTLTITFLLEIYFLLEMKRVQIWLESKEPVELQASLHKFKIIRILFLLFVIGVQALIFLSSTLGFNSTENFNQKLEIYQLIFRFMLLLSFIFYNFANLTLYKYFLKRKAQQILQEKSKMSFFQQFSLGYLLTYFVIMIFATLFYTASLIQAVMLKQDQTKTQLHKICDSLFFLLVRIQDFMISLMIAVVFYRLAFKKKRPIFIYKVEAKPKKFSQSFGTVDLKELLKNGTVKGGPKYLETEDGLEQKSFNEKRVNPQHILPIGSLNESLLSPAISQSTANQAYRGTEQNYNGEMTMREETIHNQEDQEQQNNNIIMTSESNQEMNSLAQHWLKKYQQKGIANYMMPEFGAFAQFIVEEIESVPDF